MSLSAFLKEGIPSHLVGSILTVTFPRTCSLHKDSLQKKENKQLIEGLISEFFKKKLKLKFILSFAEAQKKDIHKKNDKDSFLHSAMNIFNARLL